MGNQINLSFCKDFYGICLFGLLGLVIASGVCAQDLVNEDSGVGSDVSSLPDVMPVYDVMSPGGYPEIVPLSGEEQMASLYPSGYPAVLPMASSPGVEGGALPGVVQNSVILPIPVVSGEAISSGASNLDERISLDLKGIEITEFFRILSLKMNLTIVPSRNVTGRVNIFLNNLTFEDALDVILASQDLAADRRGNTIHIMTSAEFERLYGKRYNEKRIQLAIQLKYARPATVFNAISQIKSDIGKIITDEATGLIMIIDIPEKVEMMEKMVRRLDQPLETAILDIQYAQTDALKAQLASTVTSGTGEFLVDQRSGKLVVSDLADKMKKIRQVVKALDEPTLQVFIEAEILQIDVSDEFQREIDWTKIFKSGMLDGVNLTGTYPVNPSFSPSASLNAVNTTMTVGTLDSHNYESTFRFLETLGNAKVLSRPRIAALSGEEAKVLVGTREAYITSTQSQAETTTITSESVEFIDVGVKITILPVINTDGFVTLKIKPEVSSVKDTITTQTGSRVPIVSTSEAETMIKVKDGTMIMIAGLMEEVKREDTAGVPILRKIPGIGGLFGSKATQNKRAEIVIFITPHIFSGDVPVSNEVLQKHIPPDMAMDSVVDRMIKEKIQAIDIDPVSPRNNRIDSTESGLKRQALPEFSLPEEKSELQPVSSRIKGIKKMGDYETR